MIGKHSGRVLLVVALMLTALLALAGGAMAMDAAPAQAAAAPAALEIGASQDVTTTEALTDAVPAGPMDIVDTAVAAGSFKTLASALSEKGLVEALKGDGPFTVFAPTDAAFQALPLKERIALYRGADTLEQTLLYHVVAGTVMAADITDGMTVETLQGGTLTFGVEGGSVTVNGVPVSKADVEATNGVIHVIDSVLTLSSEAAAPAAVEVTETEVVTEAVEVTETEVVTEAVEVTETEVVTEAAAVAETAVVTEAAAVAETEVVTEAAAVAETEVVTEAAAVAETEVVTEAAAVAETAVVTEAAEAVATEVVTESMTEAPATLPTTGAARQSAGTIVDIAVANPDFSTLVAAVTAAGLVDALSGDGPFTVFAPTNDAFAKIPQDALNALLADPTGDLTQILLYHVVPGKVMAADVTDGLSAATLQGATVTFSVVDGVVKINDAVVTVTDIEASNGVIHVIDTVLSLPAVEAAPEVVAEPVAEAPAMTETVEAAAAEVVTETVEAAPAEVVTETVEAAAAEVVTETVEAAAAEVVTETVEAAAAEVVTETVEAAPAEVVTETVEASPADAAPETLPVTGGAALPSMNLSLLAGGLVLMILAMAAFITRRRTA